MKKFLIICVLTLFALTTSTLHAEDLDKQTLQKAAQKYLDTAYPKPYFSYEFPVTIENDDTMDKSRLEALEKCGIVSLIDQKTIQKHGIGFKKIVDVQQFTYDITEKGKKFIIQTSKTERMKSGSSTAIAFGKAEVVDIISFTPEKDFGGQKISEVKFSYKVTGIPEWAETPELLDANKWLKKDIESAKAPISAKAVFFYKNNDWVHEKLFK